MILRENRSRPHPLLAGVLTVLLGIGLAGCDGKLLDVDDSGIIVPTDLDDAGPSAIPTLTNGIIGSYQEALDGIVRYAALLTDEMILAGTFPTRTAVDNRRIAPNNNELEIEMYGPLHQARFQADTTVFQFEQHLDDPEFAESIGALQRGIAIGKLYGGYARLWLGELYCWSILTGMYPEDAPVLPDDRIEEAIALLEDAAAAAAAASLPNVQLAAIVGQARGHLWLGNFEEAGNLAEVVPRGWIYRAEYSASNPDQYNGMYAFTWGDTQRIRWTIGDSSIPQRGSELFEHLGQFIALNLVSYRPPGFTAFVAQIPVARQNLYGNAGADMMLASWAEAALIRAELAVRSGETADAQVILNDLRSDYSVRMTVEWGVAPPSPQNQLGPVALTGQMVGDIKAVVNERARELWLTGDRQTTARRLRLDSMIPIDLYPPKLQIGGGDDIAFPIVELELSNNSSAGAACPAGQTEGAWR